MTPELVQELLSRRIVRDFLRFAAVGAVATAAHYSVLIALKELAGMHPVWATVCGYGVGAVVSYTLNRIFTFEVKPAYGKGLLKSSNDIADIALRSGFYDQAHFTKEFKKAYGITPLNYYKNLHP